MFRAYKGNIEIDKDNLPGIDGIQDILNIKDKELRINILLYTYLRFSRDNDNPYKDYKAEYRSKVVGVLVFGNNFELVIKKYKFLLNKFGKAYEKYYVNKLQQDIDLYDKKMYQFIDLLKTSEPEIIKNTHELSGRVTFSTNIDIITTILDNSINMILDKAELVAMQKTGKFTGGLRGSLSPNSKGKLIKTKDKR